MTGARGALYTLGMPIILEDPECQRRLSRQGQTYSEWREASLQDFRELYPPETFGPHLYQKHYAVYIGDDEPDEIDPVADSDAADDFSHAQDVWTVWSLVRNFPQIRPSTLGALMEDLGVALDDFEIRARKQDG